jgi:chromosome segregation ATPase
MTNVDVAVAQSALAVAQQREREEHQQQLITQLQSVRGQLVAKQTEYDAMRAEVLALRERRRKLQAAMREILDQITLCAGSKPRHAELMPTDKSVIEWNKAASRLESLRAAVHAELAQTSHVDMLAFDLSKLGAEIQRLQFSEANLSDALDPQPRGGVAAISEPPNGGIRTVKW